MAEKTDVEGRRDKILSDASQEKTRTSGRRTAGRKRVQDLLAERGSGVVVGIGMGDRHGEREREREKEGRESRRPSATDRSVGQSVGRSAK